jgi:nitroreductase/NAD-dependent dihydropyrimidine dehydrogenase PreA subunit
MVPRIAIDPEICIVCGDCVRVCPSIFSAAAEGIRITEEEHCTLCGHCLAVCPTEAIVHSGLDKREFREIPPGAELPPENLFAFLRSRRSCRSYAPREVPRPLLEKLIDIARYAPTGHNSQNVSFVVVQTRDRIRELAGRTAVFYGNLFKMLSAPGVNLPPWLMAHMRGFRLNWEDYRQGKDRIFRDAPALILIHAPAENVSSAQNCHLAMAHIIFQAASLGLGTCLNGYFVSAAERDPSIVRDLEIPKENKIFTCCTAGFPALKFRRLVQRNPPAVRWL